MRKGMQTEGQPRIHLRKPPLFLSFLPPFFPFPPFVSFLPFLSSKVQIESDGAFYVWLYLDTTRIHGMKMNFPRGRW